MQKTPHDYHIPVLLNPLVDGLNISTGDYVVDATFGGGGHTRQFLDRVGSTGIVLGIDRDADALERGSQVFKNEIAAGNLHLVLGEFSNIEALAKNTFPGKNPQGVCADLGVSSHQLDTADRGFSLAKDGPLDMRMNTKGSRTAADIVNTASEDDLSFIFSCYGEEPKAKKLARAIVTQRQIKAFSSTLDFAAFCKKVLAYYDSKTHPATRVFQALRIAVNEELKELEQVLTKSFNILSPGGRLGIISFHSLEDRMVKHTFKNWAFGELEDPNLKKLPIRTPNKNVGALGKIIKPFPINPTDDELRINSRSRSAKLRIFEKN